MDNNTSYTNNFKKLIHNKPSHHKIAALIQHNTQTCERCLWTFSRLLNLKKFLYYIMAWTFDDEGYAWLLPSDRLPKVKISSETSNHYNDIQHYNWNTVYKLLGNMMSSSLQMKIVYKALKACISHYSQNIVTILLTRHDIWITYHAIFLPGITYTLPISFHHRERLKIESYISTENYLKL